MVARVAQVGMSRSQAASLGQAAHWPCLPGTVSVAVGCTVRKMRSVRGFAICRRSVIMSAVIAAVLRGRVMRARAIPVIPSGTAEASCGHCLDDVEVADLLCAWVAFAFPLGVLDPQNDQVGAGERAGR